MTRQVEGPELTHQHSGGENLEVMREAENYNRFLRDMIRRYAGTPSVAIDFGAGIGTFSDSLDLPAGQVHCVEPDASARHALEARGYLPHADLGEVTDTSIDYLFSLNVLEHIDDDLAALKDMYRVLRPGGRLFVYVPAFMLLYTSMDAHVGHVRRYRLKQLRRIVAQAGFTIETSAYTDALGFFATLAYRLLDKTEAGPLSPRTVRFYDRFVFPLSRALSIPLSRIIGKNVFVVATRPK